MKKILLPALLLAGVCLSCNSDDQSPASSIILKDYSKVPVLAIKQPGFENLEMYSLLTSDDTLKNSPAFIFGGSADGSGLIKSTDSTYTFLVNNEDNFAVSRITLDKTFKPVKGDYLLNSDGAQWRVCSATLATKEEHGFGPLFMTSGESGEESQAHGLDPFASVSDAGKSKVLNGLGRLSGENPMPLNKNAYPGKTVIVITDDDSGVYGGQVFMYVSNTVGDLENGSFYMLKRNDDNQKETDMKVGTNYPVSFVKVDNHKTLTGAQINAKVADLKAIKFGRVEDIDYRKSGGAANRETYFTVTGQPLNGTNADASRTKYGRVYKLILDENDPLKGTLSVILDGDDRNGKAGKFQNPDNIMVTDNYVYIQEDPNTYGDETHDAYIYQYNINTGDVKVVLELDHRRTKADAAKYNVGGASKFGSWEYGGFIDVSTQIGVPNTFMLCIQPHTWTGNRYKGVDGGSKRLSENQASQIVLIKGLAK